MFITCTWMQHAECFSSDIIGLLNICIFKEKSVWCFRVMARLFVDGARCGADALMDRFHAFTGSFNELIGSFLERWEGLTERWNQIWN